MGESGDQRPGGEHGREDDHRDGGERHHGDERHHGSDHHHGGERHHGSDHHHGSDPGDYLKAMAEYRKTFPTKGDVERLAPDPATRELIKNLRGLGLESPFERFDKQKPHCAYGLAGACCRNCVMGPCRITAKSPRGVCGADGDLVAARGLLRMIAAGVAAHGARGRECMLALRAAALGELDVPIEGEAKVRGACAALGVATEGRDVKSLALELAEVLLEDVARTVPGRHRTLAAFAALERQRTWEGLDILPIGANHEVSEAFHRTSTGTDGDWRNVMRQFHRCGLAFAFSSVLGSSIAMDALYGPPRRQTTRCDVGALRADTVNIAVHGHSPVLVSEILRIGRSPELIALARQAGAEGISFYGICCSGLSAMYRLGGVVPLSNAVGAELVLGTGALDLWVADVQDVFPSIMDVADCLKTVVVTTSDSGRLPGAEHFGYDHRHSNLSQTAELAEAIVRRAVKAHAARRDVPRLLTQGETEAEVGFSVESVVAHFKDRGGLSAILEALRDGRILGIVNLVGCSNPKVLYERAVHEVALHLIRNNVLVLTNGCASFPLMKMGLCALSGAAEAGKGLRAFLGGGLPPVWHVGECLDNARSSALFKSMSEAAGLAIKDMPFAFASPEWSNEKGLGAATSFRLLGLDSYHCVHAPVAVSGNLRRYLFEETRESLGSVMVVDPDPLRLSQRIVGDLAARRRALGWKVPGGRGRGGAAPGAKRGSAGARRPKGKGPSA